MADRAPKKTLTLRLPAYFWRARWIVRLLCSVGLCALATSASAQSSSTDAVRADAIVQQARYVVGIFGLFLVGYLTYCFALRKSVRVKSEELAAAREDLEKRGRALRSLMELGHTLARARNSQAITAHIVAQIRDGIGFDRVGIYMVDEAKQEFRGVSGVDVDGNIEDCSRYVFPLSSSSPMAQVARGELDYYFTENAGREIGNNRFVRHNAFVPMRTADRVLGVIAVDNYLSGRPFGEDEVCELRGFADEIALAFHNSILLERAEEQQLALADRNRELSVLVAFGQAATSVRTVEELVAHVWRTVKEGLGFDRVGIYLKEGDLIRSAIGTDEGGRMEVTRDISWPAMSEQGRWRLLMSGERDYTFTRDLTAEEGIRTRSGKPVKEHIVVALRTQEQVIGAIAVDNFVTGRPIQESDAEQLAVFARQAATALQSVTLLEALQSSEERLRLLVTSLTEALYSARVTSGSLTPVFYSPRIEDLTGYSSDEALASAEFWPGLIHPDDRARYRMTLLEILQGETRPIEYRIIHRSGEARWVLDTPTPVRDDQGKVIRVNGALLDITERKHLEEGLRRAQKMETVGTLAGGIAHEFNNLLAIIQGNVELAQLDVEKSNPAQHSLAQSQKAIQRAAELTKQLLTFSAKLETRREPVKIDQLVAETMELVKSSIGKSIRLQVRLEPGLEEVSADSAQLQQVLVNLCVNARHAMPQGGELRVVAEMTYVSADHPSRPVDAPTGRFVVMSVADTGTGMDARTQERIFEPFYTTKPLGQGTGLGLAVAYGIVSEHSGWIEVESAPGEGTTFRIYLPGISATERMVNESLPASPTALVVEASPSARTTLVEILERLGYSTVTAATAAEALAIFWVDADMVDLVISDARPAGMEVESLIANLRGFKPDVPILVGASSHSGEPPDLEGIAVSVIRKPYDEMEIAEIAGRGRV